MGKANGVAVANKGWQGIGMLKRVVQGVPYIRLGGDGEMGARRCEDGGEERVGEERETCERTREGRAEEVAWAMAAEGQEVDGYLQKQPGAIRLSRAS